MKFSKQRCDLAEFFQQVHAAICCLFFSLQDVSVASPRRCALWPLMCYSGELSVSLAFPIYQDEDFFSVFEYSSPPHAHFCSCRFCLS